MRNRTAVPEGLGKLAAMLHKQGATEAEILKKNMKKKLEQQMGIMSTPPVIATPAKVPTTVLENPNTTNAALPQKLESNVNVNQASNNTAKISAPSAPSIAPIAKLELPKSTEIAKEVKPISTTTAKP